MVVERVIEDLAKKQTDIEFVSADKLNVSADKVNVSLLLCKVFNHFSTTMTIEVSGGQSSNVSSQL